MQPFPPMVIHGLYGDATVGARATDPTLPYVPKRARRATRRRRAGARHAERPRRRR